MEFFWEIVQYDGTITLIPPDSVEAVRKRRERNLPVQTSVGDITPGQIKFFRLTDKPFNQTNLIEEAAQAFNEPITNEAGDIMTRWVKKHVTQDKYNKYYAAIPSYRRLEDENNMAVIAFRVARHDVDITKVSYCTEMEIKQLLTHK